LCRDSTNKQNGHIINTNEAVKCPNNKIYSVSSKDITAAGGSTQWCQRNGHYAGSANFVGFDGKIFPLITGYRFEKGKKIIVRFFHIEQQYYQYLRAISAADRSNGNPFAQPSTIRSPMEGNGYGIFTSLNYRTIILQP
jgi:hypothetical protein